MTAHTQRRLTRLGGYSTVSRLGKKVRLWAGTLVGPFHPFETRAESSEFNYFRAPATCPGSSAGPSEFEGAASQPHAAFVAAWYSCRHSSRLDKTYFFASSNVAKTCFPFRRLHGWQAVTRLSMLLEPPRA